MHRPILALTALLACGARSEAAAPVAVPLMAPGASIAAQLATAAPVPSVVSQAPVMQAAPLRPPPMLTYRPRAEFALPGRTVLRDAVVLTGAGYSRALVLPAAGTYQITGALNGNTDAVLGVTPTARTGGRPTTLALQSPVVGVEQYTEPDASGGPQVLEQISLNFQSYTLTDQTTGQVVHDDLSFQ